MRASGLLCLLAGLAAAPLAAEPRDYVLALRGLPVAAVRLDSEAAEGRYAVRGDIRTIGLAGLLRPVSYQGSASGLARGARLTPERYEGRADTGKRQSEVVMVYDAGVPRVVHYASPRVPGPDAPDPATQGGTVDPLTAIWTLLRDAPREGACAGETFLFDGRRRSRIVLRPLARDDGGLSCAGQYRRLLGYTPEELAERTGFPFRVDYLPGQDGLWQVEKVTFQSLYGPASFYRR